MTNLREAAERLVKYWDDHDHVYWDGNKHPFCPYRDAVDVARAYLAANPADDEPRETPIEITQGAAKVNSATVIRRGRSVVAISLDTASKRCAIGCLGSDGDVPMLAVDCDEETLHVDESVSRDSSA